MKHRAKTGAALVLALVLGVCSLCACGQNGSQQNSVQTAGTNTPTVQLTYYTIGTPDVDLTLVNQELNRLLSQKIGVTVDYRKIDWEDYHSQISALISSGQNFDIVYALNYTQDAQQGAYLPLNDYLATTGKEMYGAIDPVFWEGVSIDGQIYGVPTNKELVAVEQWMFAKELVDKYDIDVEAYPTLASLQPLFEMVQQQEPDYLVMELDRSSNNFFALDGYEYVLDKSLPLMVQSTARTPRIVNIFSTDTGRATLATLRQFYLAGYINQDAAVKPHSGLERDKKVFFRTASGGPYSDTVWSNERGYQVVCDMKSEPVVTTESTRTGVMSVNARTAYPEECVRFLNCLNTDPEVRNLLNYGIPDKHYHLDENGQVANLENDRYSGVQYTQGNWFILHTRAGEPANKWEDYRRYNQSAVKSRILGFTPQLTTVQEEIAAVTAVNEKYYASLMTGGVGEEYLDSFNRELEEAGLGVIQQELQRQLDTWLATQ